MTPPDATPPDETPPDWSHRLLQAADRHRPLDPPPALTADEAARIQAALLERRCARGERLVGHRIVTAADGTPVHGCLTDRLQVADGAVLDVGSLITPRARAALAFRIVRAIPADADEAEIDPSIGAVAPALDVAAPRWPANDAAALTADNGGLGAFVVGEWRALTDPLARIALELSFEPAPPGPAAGSAVIDAPRRLARAAIAHRQALGETIPEGAMILVPAPGAGLPLGPGVTVRVSGGALGATSVFTAP